MVAGGFMATHKAREAIKTAMPGMKIVEAPTVDIAQAVDVDVTGSDLRVLRRKYLSAPYASDIMSDVEANQGDSSEVVYVAPKTNADFAHNPGRRAVIINDGKIVGAQG